MLTGENWNEVMYNSVEVTNPSAVIYFIIVVIIGTFIVLNLTLAILLSNFGALPASEAEKTPEDSADDETPSLLLCLTNCLPCDCWKKVVNCFGPSEDGAQIQASPPEPPRHGGGWNASNNDWISGPPAAVFAQPS